MVRAQGVLRRNFSDELMLGFSRKQRMSMRAHLIQQAGETDLPDGSTGVNGLEAENEDIRSHLIGFDALMTMVDQLEAANAPLVIAAYWLARHRERLRLEAPAATPDVT